MGGPVASAVNSISKLDPPRSWAKDEKLRFYALPYDLQLVVNRRIAQAETEMRRAQNEAAEARQKLNAAPKRKKANGIQQDAAA